MSRHVGLVVTPRPTSDRISAAAVGTWPRSPDHQPYARVGRYLSVVALQIYLSRDWVTDPENKILRGGDCRGQNKLNFSSYLFWAIQCLSNALAMWRCHPIYVSVSCMPGWYPTGNQLSRDTFTVWWIRICYYHHPINFHTHLLEYLFLPVSHIYLHLIHFLLPLS